MATCTQRPYVNSSFPRNSACAVPRQIWHTKDRWWEVLCLHMYCLRAWTHRAASGKLQRCRLTLGLTLGKNHHWLVLAAAAAADAWRSVLAPLNLLKFKVVLILIYLEFFCKTRRFFSNNYYFMWRYWLLMKIKTLNNIKIRFYFILDLFFFYSCQNWIVLIHSFWRFWIYVK